MSEQIPVVVDTKYVIICGRAGYSWMAWQGADEMAMTQEFWKELRAGNQPRVYEYRPMSLV